MAKLKRDIGELILTAEEQSSLERYARGRAVSQALGLRAKIVLRCARGDRQYVIARELSVTEKTVRKWERRFAARRVAGLSDMPKPNVHRKLADERVEEIIRMTLESQPKGSTHWSTRKLAKVAGASQSSVSRVWRAFSSSRTGREPSR